MPTWSVYFTDTTDSGPQVGDGRPYTAGEWRTLKKYLWGQGDADRGVVKGALNECEVTVLGANSLQVDTGMVMVNGGFVVMEAAETLAPASAAPGTSRKDSVIAELDLDGSGVGQYKIRVTYKQGTAGAYPSMTQNAATVWQIRLYNFTIDDAGAITGLSDQRQYLRPGATFDHGQLDGLADDDHVNYYNAVRHTKAVHDALLIDADTVDTYHAADLITAGAAIFLGMTVLWGGTIGGSDGHRPIVGGAALETWHLANGETVNGVVTLDSRDRFPVGAGSSYGVNWSGGANTINIAHTHTYTGTTSWDGAHTHTYSGGTTQPNVEDAADQNFDAAVEMFGTSVHIHAFSGTTVSNGSHNHTAAGTTASSLSATQSIVPLYRAWYYMTYVGT